MITTLLGLAAVLSTATSIWLARKLIIAKREKAVQQPTLVTVLSTIPVVTLPPAPIVTPVSTESTVAEPPTIVTPIPTEPPSKLIRKNAMDLITERANSPEVLAKIEEIRKRRDANCPLIPPSSEAQGRGHANWRQQLKKRSLRQD